MAFKLRSGNSALPFKQMGSTATQAPLQPPTPPQPAAPFAKTYREAYDAQSAEKKSGQTFEQFETAAKAWNAKKYGTTEPTRDGNLKAKPAKDEVTRQQITDKTNPKTGAVTSTIQSASANNWRDAIGGPTVNRDRPYDAAIDSKSTPKAEPTKKEARVAKRATSKKNRTERKDTKRQAKDMKDIGKLVAKHDKTESKKAPKPTSPSKADVASLERTLKNQNQRG